MTTRSESHPGSQNSSQIMTNRLGESVVTTTGKVKKLFGEVPGSELVTENRCNCRRTLVV